MHKKIEVLPYNPIWSDIFEKESNNIRQAIGENFLEIHHIGSTSVIGLSAKPIIDIILVAKNNTILAPTLEKLGYKSRGELNIPFRQYFTKKETPIKIHLHTYEKGNPEIDLNLIFRDSLRSSPDLRKEYTDLKFELLSQEASHHKSDLAFTGYTLGKYEFITKTLKQAGFDKLRISICTHPREWEAYHRIRKELIFDLMKVQYDPNHPTITAPNHYHFVLYKGVTIIGVAHLEFLSATEAALRPFAIDTLYQNRGLGSAYLTILEKWLQRYEKTILRLHANVKAHSFYERLGYKLMPFNEERTSINHPTIDMEKNRMKEIKTQEDIELCYDAFKELRPHLSGKQEFLTKVFQQQKEGYQISAIIENDEVVACIGYRLLNMLAWGKILYIDDLITKEKARGKGHASHLLSYVINYAKAMECKQVHLDTGYMRHAAHKVYLNHGFTLNCHHLSLTLD